MYVLFPSILYHTSCKLSGLGFLFVGFWFCFVFDGFCFFVELLILFLQCFPNFV